MMKFPAIARRCEGCVGPGAHSGGLRGGCPAARAERRAGRIGRQELRMHTPLDPSGRQCTAQPANTAAVRLPATLPIMT